MSSTGYPAIHGTVFADDQENIAIRIGSVLIGYPVILGTLLRMWEIQRDNIAIGTATVSIGYPTEL